MLFSVMTRTQAMATVQATIDKLSGERVQLLADMVQSWTEPTVFSTLPATEHAKLDAAIDSIERGEGIPWDAVKADLDARLKAAGA